jgi:flagellar hook-length control protein FliK
MSQTDSPNIQPAIGKGAAGFLAALRNSFNLLGTQDSVFADMLAQAAAAQQANARPDATGNVGDQTSGDAAPTNSGTVDTESDDRAALRALLQRIREDSQALYEGRRRIRHVSAHHGHGKCAPQKDDTDAADTANASDDVSSGSDEAAIDAKTDATTAASAVNAAAPAFDAAETAATGSDSTQNLSNAAVVATPVVADPTNAPATDQAKSSTGDEAPADTATDTKAILEDLLDAEQAALLLLRHMLQEKTAAFEAGGGAATATDASQADAADANADVNSNTEADTGLDAAAMPMASEADTDEKPVTTKPSGSAPTDFLFRFLNDRNTQDLSSGGKAPSGFESLMGRNASKQVANDVALPAGKAADHEEFLTLFNNATATPSGVVRAATADGSSVKGADITGVAGTGGVSTAASLDGSSTTSSTQAMPEAVSPAGSYDFASQLSAARVTKGGTSGLPSAVEQVALQLHKQVKDGNQEMTLQLKPAELGRIEIKLSFSDGNKVKGTVVADNPATLDLLLKDVGSLQRALQDAGLRADPGSLQFSLRGDGQANLFNSGANGNGSSGYGTPDNTAFNVSDSSGTEIDPEIETYYLTPGRVNLRV